jgi:hypothetical protein
VDDLAFGKWNHIPSTSRSPSIPIANARSTSSADAFGAPRALGVAPEVHLVTLRFHDARAVALVLNGDVIDDDQQPDEFAVPRPPLRLDIPR